MNLQDFKQSLSQNPDHELLIRLPSGTTLDQHFHVTEIGKVTKDFVDCGGTRRSTETCMLQTLVADDIEHRIKAGKLAAILEKASVLGLGSDVTVEAEIQNETISLYSFANATSNGNQLIFELAAKQTECLAPDACGLGPETVSLPVANTGNC